MGVKVERKSLSTIDFESAEADMGYKNGLTRFSKHNQAARRKTRV